jgi:hypothetical protein
MAQHWDLKKGSGFKPTGVQVKVLAALSVTERDLGVPTACRSCLLLCFHKTKNRETRKKIERIYKKFQKCLATAMIALAS